MPKLNRPLFLTYDDLVGPHREDNLTSPACYQRTLWMDEKMAQAWGLWLPKLHDNHVRWCLKDSGKYQQQCKKQYLYFAANWKSAASSTQSRTSVETLVRPSSVGALSIIYPRKRARINGGNVFILGATADSRVRHLLYASSQRVAGEYGEGGNAVIAELKDLVWIKAPLSNCDFLLRHNADFATFVLITAHPSC